MVKEIIWTKKAEIHLFEIMDYYFMRNKSKTYSLKLQNEIKNKLKRIDFTVAKPQQTNFNELFYFIHKHISVFFTLEEENIVVLMLCDERRNPKDLEEILSNL